MAIVKYIKLTPFDSGLRCSYSLRNPNLNKAAIKAAKDIKRIDSKSARWIASDAIRELESEAVQRRLRK